VPDDFKTCDLVNTGNHVQTGPTLQGVGPVGENEGGLPNVQLALLQILKQI